MLSKGFLPATLPDDPMPLFEEWFNGARKASAQPNPDGMALATATADGRPSVRVVLCKKLITSPGYVAFFTNYDSRKGGELDANPRAAAVFHWDAFGRQVRLEGLIVRSPADESDGYFGQPRARQPHRSLGEPADPAARFAQDAAEARRGRGRAVRYARAASAALGRLPALA